MRSLFNLRVLAFVAALTIILLVACRRQDVFIQSNPVDEARVRSWFHKYGGAYKNEGISIQTPGGIATATLDWSKAKPIHWQNKTYLDVPYVFANGSRHTIGNDEIPPASFNLVVRIYENGGYRGALRTTAHARDRTVQSYTLLDGRNANMWMSNSKYKDPIAIQRLNITEAEYNSLKQKQEASPSVATPSQTVPRSSRSWYDPDGCLITETTTYSGNCNYSIGETVYVTLCKHTSYTRDCPPKEPPMEPESPRPPGGGGGGGIIKTTPQCPPAESYDPSAPPPAENKPDNRTPITGDGSRVDDPCNPFPPVKPEVPVEDPDFPSDCSSWNYIPVNSNYQVAGVNELYVDYFKAWIGKGGKLYQGWERFTTETLYFEFPLKRKNGEIISAEKAARLTAQAKDEAEEAFETFYEKRVDNNVVKGKEINDFINNYLRPKIEAYGGRVNSENSYNISSSSKRKYEKSAFPCY